VSTRPRARGDYPIWVQGPHGPIFGVLSSTGSPLSPGFVVVAGAGRGGSTKADGVFVRVARSVAAAGYDVIRFDWHGIGNSLGDVPRFSKGAPYTGDVRAMTDFLAEEGRSVALAGFCYGSKAVIAAADQIENLIGLVLVAHPMPHQPKNRHWAARKVGFGRALTLAFKPAVARGWFDQRSRRLYLKWIRIRFEDTKSRLAGNSRKSVDGNREESLSTLANKLDGLLQRGVRVRFVYGEGDPQLHLFRDAAAGPLKDVITRGGDMIEVVATDGDLYGWRTIEAQERAIAVIADFASRLTSAQVTKVP
jgi:alpha/beta superfamily hydrolase